MCYAFTSMYYYHEAEVPKPLRNMLTVTVSGDSTSTPVLRKNVFTSAMSPSRVSYTGCCSSVSTVERHRGHNNFSVHNKTNVGSVWQPSSTVTSLL